MTYISSAGNNLGMKEISLNQYTINKFRNDPSLLMTKSEYNKYLKEQQKELLDEKHHDYYKSVNDIIDYANENRESLVIKDGKERLLEMDHIIPVAKGGCTVEENLQTLCWKCNRSKGDKIIT